MRRVASDAILVRVAKALAAADRGIPGREETAWEVLSVDEQARYVSMARLGVEAYLEAVAARRLG